MAPCTLCLGGGRNPISARFLGHCGTITINTFPEETMTSIFNGIVLWHVSARYPWREPRVCGEVLWGLSGRGPGVCGEVLGGLSGREPRVCGEVLGESVREGTQGLW